MLSICLVIHMFLIGRYQMALPRNGLEQTGKLKKKDIKMVYLQSSGKCQGALQGLNQCCSSLVCQMMLIFCANQLLQHTQPWK